MPRLIPVKNAEDLDRVRSAAAADEHVAIAPTHIVERDGLIVGYCSIGAIPVVNAWLHSKIVHPRESVYLLNTAEAVAHAMGAQRILMPCSPNSPFHPHMERLGYRVLGDATICLKEF